MGLDLTDKETLALLSLLVDTIEANRFPFPPQIETLRGILAKLLPRGREIYGPSNGSTALP
jgi:hypothetical protein